MCVTYTPVKKTRLSELATSNHIAGYPHQAYPGHAAPIIRLGSEGRLKADKALFGLIPSWAKDKAFGKKTYNARAETVAQKPSYRAAWVKRQLCLVPMEQFYEPCWETGRAVRWSIGRVDGAEFCVAGIWDSWLDQAAGEAVLSFSMLTINADGHYVMGRFHRPEDEKRSLVAVPCDQWIRWLSSESKDEKGHLNPLNQAEFEGKPSPVESLPQINSGQKTLFI